jgi:hypothetical protein
MSDLYEEIVVWRRRNEKSVVRYMCFMNLSSRKYSVQSCDFFNLPFDEGRLLESNLQAIELFAEDLPGERA